MIPDPSLRAARGGQLHKLFHAVSKQVWIYKLIKIIRRKDSNTYKITHIITKRIETDSVIASFDIQ